MRRDTDARISSKYRTKRKFPVCPACDAIPRNSIFSKCQTRLKYSQAVGAQQFVYLSRPDCIRGGGQVRAIGGEFLFQLTVFRQQRVHVQHGNVLGGGVPLHHPVQAVHFVVLVGVVLAEGKLVHGNDAVAAQRIGDLNQIPVNSPDGNPYTDVVDAAFDQAYFWPVPVNGFRQQPDEMLGGEAAITAVFTFSLFSSLFQSPP